MRSRLGALRYARLLWARGRKGRAHRVLARKYSMSFTAEMLEELLTL
jgi:hypothetical protein